MALSECRNIYMKKLSPLTYLNFSDELHYLKKENDIEEILSFFKYINRFQNNLSFLRDTTFFIIDYTKRKYLLLTGPVKEIIGHHQRDFLDGGLQFVIDLYQKDDFYLWNNKIFVSTFDLLKQQQHTDHSSYVFEINFRLRDKKGDLITVLQKGSFVTDPLTSLPLFGFGICSNITPFKKDNSMVQVISKYDDDNKQNIVSHISTNYYYPNPEEALLTKRETEILKWMAEGLSSKQIADKFKLSFNTVMNHRKNILRKTNTKNVAELIKHAIMNGII